VGVSLKLGALCVCAEVAVGQTTGRLSEIPELLGLAAALAAVIAAARLGHTARAHPTLRRQSSAPPGRPHGRASRIGMPATRRHDRAGRARPRRRSRFRTDT